MKKLEKAISAYKAAAHTGQMPDKVEAAKKAMAQEIQRVLDEAA